MRRGLLGTPYQGTCPTFFVIRRREFSCRRRRNHPLRGRMDHASGNARAFRETGGVRQCFRAWAIRYPTRVSVKM